MLHFLCPLRKKAFPCGMARDPLSVFIIDVQNSAGKATCIDYRNPLAPANKNFLISLSKKIFVY